MLAPCRKRPETASLLIGAVAVSMLLSPLLLVAVDKWPLPRFASRKTVVPEEISEQQEAPALIAGFGRYGQIVTRMMLAEGFACNVMLVQRELFESSLRSVLELLGRSPQDADTRTRRFRKHNLELFEKMHPHDQDRANMIAAVREARQQLEEQMAQERLERARLKAAQAAQDPQA